MFQHFADWMSYNLLEFQDGTRLGESVNFFFYDCSKIIVLLFFISSLMGIVNAYFPIERVHHFLTTRKLYGLQYLLASLFGALTPFCSCSSIPLFLGFVRGGIPMGVTLAFLITSPLVNEVAIAMFLAAFGLKMTLIYTASGILLGCIGGGILSLFKLERYLSPWMKELLAEKHMNQGQQVKTKKSFTHHLPFILQDAWGIVRGVFLYVIIGIAIGAVVHGYVPDGFFSSMMSAENWWAVPAAVLCAVPMYANAAGIVPVMEVFVAKGIPIGTAIAFMMAVVGLSLPEAALLKKVMTWKLIAIFFGTVTIFIIFSGYLFNIIL